MSTPSCDTKLTAFGVRGIWHLGTFFGRTPSTITNPHNDGDHAAAAAPDGSKLQLQGDAPSIRLASGVHDAQGALLDRETVGEVQTHHPIRRDQPTPPRRGAIAAEADEHQRLDRGPGQDHVVAGDGRQRRPV